MRKMKMRGWLSLLLAAVMLLAGLPMEARAEGERVMLKGISAQKLAETGSLGLSVCVTDAYGTGKKLEPTEFQVQINGQSVPAVKDQSPRQGHIYVVDYSLQFEKRYNNTKELVSSLLRGISNYQNAGDGTAVIWVGEIIETETFGADNLESTFLEKRKTSKNTARLYDGILRAVNMAKSSEGGYDYYRIYIMTDGMDNNSGATLDYIAREIQDSTPLSLFTCCYYNGGQAKGTNEAAMSARTALRNFTTSVGGNYAEVNIYDKAQLESNTQKAMNMVSNETQGMNFLSVSLKGLQLDRENGKTEVTVGTTVGGLPVSQVVYLSTSAMPEPTPTPEPTVEPTPTPGPFATWGDQDSDNVRRLQATLSKYGFLNKAPDGNFDNETRDALLAYMRLVGMTAREVDGILYLSAEDWDEIQKNSATPTPAPTEEIFIMAGQQNPAENVKELQDYLKSSGWYDGEINGIFDIPTQKAYRLLLESMGITQVSDPLTITRSYFEYIKSVAPTATPAPTPTPTVELVVKKGGDTDNIKKLQDLLTRLHYYYGEIDGDFGYQTQEAYAALLSKLGWTVERANGENSVVITRAQWDDLWSYQESDLPTAAPTATPSPTPEATVEPDKLYRDLSLGDRDSGDEDYVSRMQNRLWELGYYTYVGEDRDPGNYDDRTQKALKAFFDQLGMTSMDGSKLPKGIWKDNLDAEGAPAAPVIEPSFFDRIREFLEKPVTSIGSFTIYMWMLAIVAGILLLAIIIVLVLIISRNKRRKQDGAEASEGSGAQAAGGTIKYKGPAGGAAPVQAPVQKPVSASPVGGYHGGPSQGSEENTLPGTGSDMNNNSEETMADGAAAGRTIYLDISYNGNRTPVTTTIYDQLIIGRRKENTRVDVMTNPEDKTVSRPHCELILKNDQIFIKNLSQQARGTLLNGHKVQEGDDFGMGQGLSSAEDGATMSLTDGPVPTPMGLEEVHSGDEITIGQHHIVVSW